MREKAIIFISLLFIIIGLFLTVKFTVLSITSGMWGCGQLCLYYQAASWQSLAMMGFGFYMHIKARKRKK